MPESYIRSSRGMGDKNRTIVKVVGDNAVHQPVVTFGDAATELTAKVMTASGFQGGLAGLRVFGGPTDPISEIPVGIDFPHHQLHEGECHQYTYPPAALASGASVNFIVTVPALVATTRTPHAIIELDASAEAWLYLYEAPTATGGSAATVHNRNRNAAATAPGTTVKTGASVSNVGTLLSAWIVGAGNKTGGAAREALEWLYAAGTTYLIRVTAQAAGCNVCVRLVWYEDLGV